MADLAEFDKVGVFALKITEGMGYMVEASRLFRGILEIIKLS